MRLRKFIFTVLVSAVMGSLVISASAQPPAAAPVGPGSGAFPAMSEVDPGLPRLRSSVRRISRVWEAFAFRCSRGGTEAAPIRREGLSRF
jgi:hypothetical protein